jgi:hypothetical protein
VKPTTSYGDTAKPSTSYSPVSKPTNSYSEVVKPTTNYTSNPDDVGGVQLDSTTVTLDSLTVMLTGYVGEVPGARNVPTTPFTPVAKPTTVYT